MSQHQLKKKSTSAVNKDISQGDFIICETYPWKRHLFIGGKIFG